MEAKSIISYLRAGFSLFWIKTFEPNRVREVIYDLVTSYERKDGNKYTTTEWTITKDGNPLNALQGLGSEPEFTVLFAHNFHWVADKPQVIQFIQDSLPAWQANGKALVVVSPKEKIPVELSKEFVVLDFSLPDEKEIVDSLDHVKPEDFKIAGKDQQAIINACKGLTRSEIESTLALSFVDGEGEKFHVPSINAYKAQAIKKTGFLGILQPVSNFSDIIGYNYIKQFIADIIFNPKSKGIIIVGPPGCGKTSLLKAIIGEFKLFGLEIKTGKLFSKYQGETDQNVSTTIDILSSVGDVVCLIDEFEKQFAGTESDGSMDSGVTARASSQWLDFLQSRPPGVRVFATANTFRGIPPEYLRPGRWDSSPFFLDLPNDKVKTKILQHYCSKEGLAMPVKADTPKMDLYSGAEIEAMCHIASMRGIGLKEAEKCVISVAKANKGKIDALRNWAADFAVPAEEIPGMQVINGGKRKLDA